MVMIQELNQNKLTIPTDKGEQPLMYPVDRRMGGMDAMLFHAADI
jgi:hypothetical protein